MHFFNCIACIALEHLSARDHLYNLSSLIGFGLFFRREPTVGHLPGAAPLSPASTAGMLDDVNQGWQDGVRTMASLQHFSSPLILFSSAASQYSIYRYRSLHKQ